MKNIKLNPLALAMLVAVGGISAANAGAGIVGGQSYSSDIEVGASTVTGGPHSPGASGIGVDNGTLSKADKVDFAGLATVITPSDGVYTLSTAPTSHGGMGVFNFAQIGSADVWIGNWSESGDVTDGTHAVYYVGDDGDTSVPNSGVATYTVVGINDFANQGLLDDSGSGNFTADFGDETLEGEVSDGSGFVVDIGTATINSNGTFSGNGGTATQGLTTLASGGDVEGRFFNSQSELAGFVKFDPADREYDTAFGGAKD